MKLFYRFRSALCFVALLGLVTATLGQVASEPGNFRFANAAGLTGKVLLMIDTVKPKPEGFAAGETTGSIGMLTGAHRFTASNAEAGSASATLNLQPGASTTMIAYCQIAVDPRTNAPKKALQLLQRANPPVNGGKHFQLLYLSNKPTADVVMNGAPAQLGAMREVNGGELPGGKIKIEQAGKTVVTFTAPQPGNFLVILYDDAAGKLAGVVLPDYK